MNDRPIPLIGDPPKKNKIRVRRSEIKAFLDRKRLPFSKRNRKMNPSATTGQRKSGAGLRLLLHL